MVRTTKIATYSIALFFLCCISCKTKKINATKSNDNDCGVIDSLSDFYHRTKHLKREDFPYIVPTSRDAEESSLILGELKSRLGNIGLNIGKSPQVLHTVVILEEPFTEKNVTEVRCILKDIHDTYNLKPIMLRLVGQRLVKDKSSGEMVSRRMPFKQYVIE